MTKPRTLGIKEATALGLSRVIRSAEEDGLIVLQRMGTDVALVLPITPQGLERLASMFLQAVAAEDTSKLESSNPDLAAGLRAVVKLVEEGLKSLREGPGNAGVRPGSARQGGVKDRRRKEPK